VRRKEIRSAPGHLLPVPRDVSRNFDELRTQNPLLPEPGTVRKHLDNAYAKLGVGSRTAAVTLLWGGRAASEPAA
jgi:hypothetical protein